jgi:hypothetical protein
MKKLMTILVLFALCGVAMASAPIDLTMNKELVWNGWYYDNEKVPTTHTYTNAQGTTGLTYTVTKSEYAGYKQDDDGRNFARYRAQTYFTTTTDVPEGKVLAVQFLGAEIEKGYASYDRFGNPTDGYNPNYGVQDYGIYLVDDNGNKVGDYLSVQQYNNYFGEEAGITAGTNFGVYFKDNTGTIYTSTGVDGKGVVGNFDDDPHDLKVYDAEHPEGYTETTAKHFLCLFPNSWRSGELNQTHWEFMLQTTLDDPYYPVNPNDFGGGVEIDEPVVNPTTAGQPLPGTLATILISSLCAAGLRKKNKK